MINLTANAAAKVKGILEQEKSTIPQGGLRIYVQGGGCSGFSYELSFAEAAAPGDHVIDVDGVQVLVDRTSAPILEGSTLEFDDALLGGGLKMLNPQATHECACGQSFAI